MSQQRPESDCRDLAFRASYALPAPAEVALEDYARALTRSRGAEAMHAGRDPAVVAGVHVCGAAAPLEAGSLADLEAFARDMAVGGAGGGLGWS
jgi:hypothetical protein